MRLRPASAVVQPQTALVHGPPRCMLVGQSDSQSPGPARAVPGLKAAVRPYLTNKSLTITLYYNKRGAGRAAGGRGEGQQQGERQRGHAETAGGRYCVSLVSSAT